MIRRLLLILFLYLLLVWTLSYLYASATLAQTAMFWSAMGVAVLLGRDGELFAPRDFRRRRAAQRVILEVRYHVAGTNRNGVNAVLLQLHAQAVGKRAQRVLGGGIEREPRQR